MVSNDRVWTPEDLAALEAFLLSAFSADDLMALLRRHELTVEVVLHVSASAAPASLVHQLVEALRARGLLTAALLELLAAARPMRAAELRALWRNHVPSAPRPPAPALSLAELEAAGVIDALADCYDTHLAATTLLHRAGVPSGRLPQIGHGTMADWWRLTLRELNKGVTEGGIGPVLSLAAQGYPGNRTLKAYR